MAQSKPKKPAPKRTAEAQDVVEPSALARVAMGAVLGAAGGLAFLGVEQTLVRSAGLAEPDLEALQVIAGGYAALGGALGLLAGVAGLIGPRWALATALGGGAWLAAGKLEAAVAIAGLPGFAAPLLGGVGAVVAIGLAKLLPTERALLGVAGLVFVASSLGFPANLHLLPSPTAPLSLAVDAAIAALAIGVGAALWALERRVPRLGAAGPLFVAAALGWGSWAARGPRPEVPLPAADATLGPALVLVVVDALRPDHLGAYGYDRPTSPNLDRFARQAEVYDDAWTAAPWTLPSFGSLFTGRWPSRHGAGLHDGTTNRTSALRPDVPTVAERLSARGYLTLGVTTNPWTTASFGMNRGFDRWDDRVGGYALPVAAHPLRVAGLDVGIPEFRSAEDVTDAALALIDGQPAGGWLLVVHYLDVHGPHDVLAEDAAALGPSTGSAYVDAYDASIRRVDRSFGRLLLGLPDEAVVIVTSDHGEELTEARGPRPGVPPGVRHGHTVFEEVLQVPLLVGGPRIGAGRVGRPVSLVDLAPTLTRLAGADEVLGDGAHLTEVTGGDVDRDRIRVAEAVRFGGELQAGRRGDDKVIHTFRGRYELFDLRDDPDERHPIALIDPATTSRARRVYADLPEVGQLAADRPVPLGDEVRGLLERLGYVDP
jgi:arylsulfatase A-like enzyme